MNSKKAAAETTAMLDEDVILKIVVGLPLKCAIRCMVLNKNLFRLISERKKSLVSSAYSDIEGSIICRYKDDTFKMITPGSSKVSITIPRRYFEDPVNPIILDSCNGVLLLEFQSESRICVFNPFTGETMPMSPYIKFELSEVTLALVVDLDSQNSFQFKLVVAETVSHSEEEGEEENRWRFTVFAPCGGTSWMIKSPVEHIYVGEPCSCDRYVYAHGCMYYADEDNQRIIVFDVEKEKARSVDWPQEGTRDSAFLSGSTDGSLQCVYVLQDGIEIHSYDQVKDVWQLKHKITNIVSYPKVLFCNGQRLLIDDDHPAWLRKKPEEVLHMYDISSDEWEKISPKDFSFEMYEPHTYFSFVPTLAKVSNKYLHDPDLEFAEVYLRGLQRLVMQETRDAKVGRKVTMPT